MFSSVCKLGGQCFLSGSFRAALASSSSTGFLCLRNWDGDSFKAESVEKECF